MKKPQKKTILKILCVFLFATLLVGIVFSCPSNVLADVGNNNRYETNSSSSSGDSDSGLINFLIYLLFDLFGPIPAIITLIIIVIVVLRLKKTGKLNKIKNDIQTVQNTINATVNTGISNLSPNNSVQVAEQVRNIDPSFSEDLFLGWAREVFIKIQQAWTDRNWKIIRPFESNELFQTHSSQLEEYIRNHKINVIEKINISYANLREFRQDGDKEVLVVELYAIMRDYVIDDKTRNVLESDPNRDYHMKYLMTFNRKAGVKTKVGTSNKSTTNCPNCGAPTEITSAGQCEYCDSVITTGEHDWVLSDIHSIK